MVWRPVSRGVQVFHLQLGRAREDAFGGTGESLYGDLFMTVTRHEAAHQFDRVVNADTPFAAASAALRAAARTDSNWLRTSVGNSYFQDAPQEVIASQVGNQYFLLSSSTQVQSPLRDCWSLGHHGSLNPMARSWCAHVRCRMSQLSVALARMAAGTSALPLAWFLFHLDLFSRRDPLCNSLSCLPAVGGVSIMFEAEVDGIVTPVCTRLTRDATGGRITKVELPGCADLTLTYPANGRVPSGFARSASECTPSLQPNAALCSANWWSPPPASTPPLPPPLSPPPPSPPAPMPPPPTPPPFTCDAPPADTMAQGGDAYCAYCLSCSAYCPRCENSS